MFQYTMDIQKHSLLKKHNDQHKNLIKKYKIHFCPLLLPKIAVLGYRLRPNPSCQIFFSRIQLTDKTIIQRQNEFIDLMKQKDDQLERFPPSRQQLFGIELSNPSSNNLKSQENKHRYSQILTSRLNDLNELIFHIEKTNKEPLLQKQCRLILEKEITKLSEATTRRQQPSQSSIQDEVRYSEGQKLFSLAQHRQEEKKLKEQNIKYLYQRNKKTQSKRISTEPNQRSSISNLKSNNSHFRSSVRDDDLFQIIERGGPDEHRESNFLPNGAADRYSLLNNPSHNKENATVRNPSRLVRRGGLIKTEANWKRNSRKAGKSVRYMIDDEESRPDKDEKYSRNSKFSGNSRQRQSRNIKFKDAGTSKMIPTTSQFAKKKGSTSKKTLTINEPTEMEDSDDNLDIIQFEDNAEPAGQASDSEEGGQIDQKDFVLHRELIKLGKRRNKRPKLSAFWSWDNEPQDKPVSKKVVKQKRRSARKRTNIYQREGARIQTEPAEPEESNPQTIKASFSRLKRHGMLLGAQANKHLQRLLRESNVEQMLLQNQFQQQTRTFAQMKQAFTKNGKRITPKEGGGQTNKHFFSAKSKILMEVDLEAQHQENQKQKNQNIQNFVNSQGLTVNAEDLKTFRNDYVKVEPYHHKALEYFYGGARVSELDYQIITNEFGQYSFNRDFIKRVKQSQEDEPQYWKFSQADPYDMLAFQFSHQLVRESQEVDQRQMVKSSILVDQPHARPLALF